MLPLPTIHEYKSSPPWKIWFTFIILISLIVIAFIIRLMMTMIFDNSRIDIGWMFFMLILCLGTAVAGYFLLYCINIVSEKLILKEDRVTYKSLLKNRTLLFSEIHGFQAAYVRVGSFSFSNNKVIAILPLEKISDRKIIISQYITHQAELLNWLTRSFKQFSGHKHIY